MMKNYILKTNFITMKTIKRYIVRLNKHWFSNQICSSTSECWRFLNDQLTIIKNKKADWIMDEKSFKYWYDIYTNVSIDEEVVVINEWVANAMELIDLPFIFGKKPFDK